MHFTYLYSTQPNVFSNINETKGTAFVERRCLIFIYYPSKMINPFQKQKQWHSHVININSPRNSSVDHLGCLWGPPGGTGLGKITKQLEFILVLWPPISVPQYWSSHLHGDLLPRKARCTFLLRSMSPERGVWPPFKRDWLTNMSILLLRRQI